MRRFSKLFLLVALCFLIGCNDKNNNASDYKLGATSTILKTKDSLVLDIKPSIEGLTFESTNSLIAECLDGKLYTFLAGEADILIKSKDNFNAQFKVTVEPRVSLYKEPYLAFGSNQAIIKRNETRKLEIDDSYIKDGNNYTELHYWGENDSIAQVSYIVENSKLVYSYLLLPESAAERVAAHIKERFYEIETDDDRLYYRHPVLPNKNDLSQFILITYSALIDKKNPNNVVTHIIVDYSVAKLQNTSNTPASLKQATNEYIKQNRNQLHKKAIRKRQKQ